MENGLTVHQGELIAAMAGGVPGELLRPLTQEIHLFDTYIAGTAHVKDEAALDEAAEGDRLTLRREENKFDDNAILVLDEKGRRLGYIPEKDNVIFARLLDAGKCLGAKIRAASVQSGFRSIKIGIYLVDF